MESCVSFWEERREMNFVVYLILPMLLVTMCKKPVHDPGSGSVTQGHREKLVQKSCVSFEEECIFVIGVSDMSVTSIKNHCNNKES